MSDNHLTEGVELEVNVELRNLDLSGNQLSSSIGFTDLPAASKLQKLDLHDNQFWNTLTPDPLTLPITLLQCDFRIEGNDYGFPTLDCAQSANFGYIDPVSGCKLCY